MKKINLLEALKSQGIELEQGQDTFLNTVSDAMNKAFEAGETNYSQVVKNAIDSVVGHVDKDDNGKNITLAETIKNLAEKVDGLSNKFKLDEQSKTNLESILKDNYEAVKTAMKNKNAFEFTFKDAEIHATNNGTVSNAVGVAYPTTDNFAMLPGFSALSRPEDMLMSFIQNRQVAKVNETKLLRQEVAGEGAFAIVEESGEKPLLQYKFENVQYKRLKIAGRIEWTEEFEYDFGALLSAIIRLFEVDLVDSWENEVIDALTNIASSYVGTSLDGTLSVPTNGLAAVAAAGQIRDLNYTPRLVVMHPSDVLATLYIQDDKGHFINQPFIDVAGRTIDGIPFITSTRIEQGHILCMDTSVFWEEHSANILRRGQYGEQFIHNEYTMVGEKFFIIFYAPKDSIAIVYDDLATIKAALQTGAPIVS